MANDRILVSVSEMESTIQEFESARNTLQDAFSRLESAKDHLDNCYKGPAYLALCAKWNGIYAKVRTADNAIEESVDGLRKTITQMNDTEANVNTAAGALEAGSDVPDFL